MSVHRLPGELRLRGRVEVEGELRVWQSEGGHAAPAVEVGQIDLEELLERLLGRERVERLNGATGDRVRVTIELLEDVPDTG